MCTYVFEHFAKAQIATGNLELTGNEIGEVDRIKVSALGVKEHELYSVCRWGSVAIKLCIIGRSTHQKREDGKHVDENLVNGLAGGEKEGV